MVDVTDVAEAIGNSSHAKGKRHADGGNQPSDHKCDPEEYLTRIDFPADLQMQSKSPPEYPDDTGPSSENEECATEGAREVRPHVVRRYLVLALSWLICERYYESKLSVSVDQPSQIVRRTYFHAKDPDGETHT